MQFWTVSGCSISIVVKILQELYRDIQLQSIDRNGLYQNRFGDCCEIIVTGIACACMLIKLHVENKEVNL